MSRRSKSSGPPCRRRQTAHRGGYAVAGFAGVDEDVLLEDFAVQVECACWLALAQLT